MFYSWLCITITYQFVDLIPMLIEQNWQSMDSMALMQPFHISDLRILQPYPNEESKLLTPIKPFTKEVNIFYPPVL